ncbi:SOS response-associated peptidase family protein [Polynucleobacter sp. 71A-WALBACH]|uniref:SOS response-associated peptidase n=1 Tax=Polynucleobacter sp. 71A-WALBACH TaxID=2689097 RepID=UPI001C0E685F|nr:SOS response-associated peptidase family protein [Polynucleobacter sp. 71A-WALBACH]MBU3593664.1 SOS response-associated peptidase family protein [Polynucleobacter sp. 71A-WALBACH]
MCLNFIASTNNLWVQDHFSIALPKKFDTEIYPGYYCPIIRAAFDAGEYKSDLAHFGLVPSWASSGKSNKYTHNVRSESMTANHIPNLHRETFNARSETVSSKPSFRTAWNRRHFALVVIEGFFQPNYESDSPVRWIIKKSDNKPFALACLWDRWTNVDLGKDIISFCILTKDASSHPLLKRFHKLGDAKRMPIIIPDNEMRHWLEANLKSANGLITSEAPLDLIGQPAPKEMKPTSSQEPSISQV